MLTPYFHSTNPSAKKLPSWQANITDFPPEVVGHILSFLDLGSLITARFCCKEWFSFAQSHIKKKLKDTSVSLTFEQESKWKFQVEFAFSSVDLSSSKVRYRVKSLKTRRCFYGILLENPRIANITLSPYDSPNVWASRCLPIKKPGVFFSVVPGRAPEERWAIAYEVAKTPPVHRDDLEPIDGERWVTPFIFECSLQFLACDSKPSFFRKVAKMLPARRRSSLIPVSMPTTPGTLLTAS
ncbi:hypothetical protein K493DRAFT_296153 [Basidiobolus meristosporus CBS 931.73]|uniref:F-box domain-containing protein n=1 Tax=Basidiobolus meristosporus CBS 931.73 TaxID=1314790 RepID=A0A1Y1Z751_9FUNG|nr:hypothetical protein K493DRAFT_296153 [Basidiobolus meristosporus CBS 931.73]|eukprot:ORY06079.1 hypothetical protein K493DRAFT_296153 [Basidiobolus meristosporus CBS 931.73]